MIYYTKISAQRWFYGGSCWRTERVEERWKICRIWQNSVSKCTRALDPSDLIGNMQEITSITRHSFHLDRFAVRDYWEGASHRSGCYGYLLAFLRRTDVLSNPFTENVAVMTSVTDAIGVLHEARVATDFWSHPDVDLKQFLPSCYTTGIRLHDLRSTTYITSLITTNNNSGTFPFCEKRTEKFTSIQVSLCSAEIWL